MKKKLLKICSIAFIASFITCFHKVNAMEDVKQPTQKINQDKTNRNPQLNMILDYIDLTSENIFDILAQSDNNETEPTISELDKMNQYLNKMTKAANNSELFKSKLINLTKQINNKILQNNNSNESKQKIEPLFLNSSENIIKNFIESNISKFLTYIINISDEKLTCEEIFNFIKNPENYHNKIKRLFAKFISAYKYEGKFLAIIYP